MEKFFNNKNLLEFIWKWKWIYVIFILLAVIMAVIFSGQAFIKPKFKSEAIVYPVNLKEYSNESNTEQMLQVLQSKQLKLMLIKSFNLYSHYAINKKYKYAQTAVLNELNDNISISKTPYESVRIEVLDYFPDTAKMMVDSIIVFYNHIVRTFQKVKYKEVIDINKVQIKKIKEENDSLKTVLIKYREAYNLYDPRLQAKQITEQYLKSKDINASRLYQNLIKHSEDITITDSLMQANIKRLITYKYQLDEVIKEYKKNITYANIISAPIVADKKSYPIRWIIVLLSVLGTFLFTFITLVFYESIQKKI